MATRIQKRRDTATNWAVNNPILASGEEGYETDTGKTKTGDDSTPWNSLIYGIHSSDVAPPTLSAVLGTGNIANDDMDMNGNAVKNVPNPIDIGDAANKAYVDQKTTNLRKLIGPIDCSTNPIYPSGNTGDTYEVIQPGKIGGDDGIIVHPWDEIVCSQPNAGGFHSEVGEYWYIVQGDVLEGTEDVSGTIRIAKQDEINSGENDQTAVTPRKLSQWVLDVLNSTFQLLSEKDEDEGYVGLKGFKIKFKNAANTFTSLLSNSNTDVRTYGFPDKSGTVALLDDIPSKSNRKIYDNLITEFAGTSTTAEEIYYSKKISANEAVDGESFDVDALATFSSLSASNKIIRLRVNTSNSLAGATILAQMQNTNNAGSTIPFRILQKIKLKSTATPSTMESAYITNAAGAIGLMSVFNQANIPLNADWWIIISGTKGIAGDTFILRSSEIYHNKL